MLIDSDLYSEQGAATCIGGLTSPLSIRTMHRWRFDGAEPIFLKLGRPVRYRKSDFDRFLEDCTYRPTVDGLSLVSCSEDKA